MPVDPIASLVEPARTCPWPAAVTEAAQVRVLARRRRASRAAATAGGCLAAGAVILSFAVWPSWYNGAPQVAATTEDGGSLDLANGTTLTLPDGWVARPEPATASTEMTCLLPSGSDAPDCPIQVRAPLPGATLTDTVQPAQVAVEGCNERADARPVEVEHMRLESGDAAHFTGRCNPGGPVASVWALDDRSLILKVADGKWDSVARAVLRSAVSGASATPARVPPSAVPEKNPS